MAHHWWELSSCCIFLLTCSLVVLPQQTTSILYMWQALLAPGPLPWGLFHPHTPQPDSFGLLWPVLFSHGALFGRLSICGILTGGPEMSANCPWEQLSKNGGRELADKYLDSEAQSKWSRGLQQDWTPVGLACKHSALPPFPSFSSWFSWDHFPKKWLVLNNPLRICFWGIPIWDNMLEFIPKGKWKEDSVADPDLPNASYSSVLWDHISGDSQKVRQQTISPGAERALGNTGQHGTCL